MISRIDHIAIAINNDEAARHFFQDILGAIPGAKAQDDNLKFRWQVFSLGDLSRIELLCPTGDNSFLRNFLAKQRAGVHHITLETHDIDRAVQVLRKNGIPYFGFKAHDDVWKEVFIHPRDAFGVLIQIAEFNPNDWLDESVKLPNGRKWRVERTDTGYILHVAHPGGGNVRLELTREEMNGLLKDIKASI